MATVEEKQDELEDIKAIHFISGALLEISAARMQELRKDIEENQNFYSEVGMLYALVKQSAAQRGHLPPEESKSKKITTVSVAFTSNRRFYGAINHDVIEHFLRGVRNAKTDCIVIGATGRSVIEKRQDMPVCQFHAFKADQPAIAEMRTFLKRVRAYRRVIIYYPVFNSVFRQDISALDITHTPQAKNVEMSVDYIFEPELPNILDFFERRIRFLLFKRAMLETELARTAARFVAMSNAERQADSTADKLARFIRQLKDAGENRSLLESLTGFAKFAQWKQM